MERKKEGDLTQSYDKNPLTNRKFKKQWTPQNATKNFDYTTTIADRLRKVNWGNNSHWFMGTQSSNLAQKLCYQKDTHFKNCK